MTAQRGLHGGQAVGRAAAAGVGVDDEANVLLH